MIPQRPDHTLSLFDFFTQQCWFEKEGGIGMKKIAFSGLFVALISFGATADTVVTSRTYVDTKDNLKQNAITAGAANTVAMFTGETTTNGGANITSRNLYSDTTAGNYVSDTHSTYIPTMGAVMAQIASSASSVLPSGTSGQILQHNGTSWVADTMDSAPTSASTKPVTSGGVYTAVDAKQEKLIANDASTYPNGSLVAYGTTAGTPTAKKIVTTIAQNGTDIPTDGAVYSAIDTIQTAVTTLQNCRHTCANANCTLITVDCVDAYGA